MRRRNLVAAAGAVVLAGCGFQLRRAPDFVFDSLAIDAPPGSPLAIELRRSLAADGKLRVLPAGTPLAQAQVVLELPLETREKVVMGINAAGLVREFQLRARVHFRLRTAQGRELIAQTELVQHRDISFNEAAVLAKEAEESLLYRDMQTDIVQQLMRRLAAVKAI